MAEKSSAAVLQAAVNAAAIHKTQVAAAVALGIKPNTLQQRLAAAMLAGIKPNGGHVDANDPQVMRATIKRMEAELKLTAKAQEQSEVVKAVIGKLSRAVEVLEPPPFVLNRRIGHGSPGVPTAFLSDLHWGEVVHPSQINGVNEYSIRLAHSRMQVFVESTIQLLKIVSTRMDYPGIVLPLGGDMISGNIHDELTATNELNSMPAVEDLYSVLVGVIKTMADTFGAVFLPCVSGNHGRDTRKIWSKDRHHTSFDWLLYRFLARHFDGDKRITFFIPDGPDAYYKVYGHRYLLTHGDQFRGGDGMIGALGPILRGDHKKRSRAGQIGMEYDTMIMGHWHQLIFHNRVIVNGSLKGYDEYAYASNFGFEPPQQALWITHPKYGHTYQMHVKVGKYERPSKHEWASAYRGSKP